MRPLPGGGHLGPQRALAAALDQARARLHQHGEVTGEQVRGGAAQPQQPVALGRDLLALVEDIGHVPARRGHVRGQPELHRDPGLHVRRAAAVHPVTVGAGGQVARDRDGVDMPGQDDPLGPPELGPGHDRVAVPADGQVGERPQRSLDGVRERAFLAADRGNVYQLGGQCRPIDVEVEIHPASIGILVQAGTGAARDPVSCPGRARAAARSAVTITATEGRRTLAVRATA